MPIAHEKSPISFKALPEELAALSENLFPNLLSSVAILPLTTIDKMTGQDIRNWLHKKESEQLATYTYAKRNREWLGGRICAKEGLRLFLHRQKKVTTVLPFSQYRVRNEESGRPCFADSTSSTFPLPQLSITHSNGLAAALTSLSHCGIDIQYSSEKLLRVKERFCTPDEAQLLQDCMPQLTEISQLTMLWAGKEAVKKMLSHEGIPGFHELNLQQLTPQNENSAVLHFSRTDRHETLSPVAAGILGNEYALTLCCHNS